MNRDIPGRTFFTSAYIILAIGFLTIHFSRVETFSTVIGPIEVQGRSNVGTPLSQPRIRRILLTAKGLELSFKKKARAVLITDDGIRHPLNIVGWEANDDSIRITFSKGTSIMLKVDPHGTGIWIDPEIPTTIPPVRSLELPFRPTSNASMAVNPDRPGTLSITVDDLEYIATLPNDSVWTSQNGRLNLVVLNKANPVLEITDDHRGGGLDVREWLAQGTAPSESTFNRRVEQWLSLSRKGWNSRIEPRSGLWTDEAGNPGWSDEIASAILADAASLGNLPLSLQSVITVAERTPMDIGWLPSPYLGNIVNQNRIHAQQLRINAQSLIAGLSIGSPNFGLEAGLTSLLDSGYPEYAAELASLVRQAPGEEENNEAILNRIRILQEARILGIDDPSKDITIRRNYFDEWVIPDIFWVRDGLWLIEEDGSINLALQITTANLLIQEAQWNNDSVYQALGRQMLISAFSYTDELGMLPARLFFESNGEVVKNGSIPPENLYPEVVRPAAYPRHVSLDQELGPGSWALIGAEKFTIQSTPRETTITVDFSVGSIHHMAIKGIKSFNFLFMNGIEWNGDPNFQRYYAGWSYSEASETLYLKIRHRVKTENIRILYYNPNTETPASTDN